MVQTGTGWSKPLRNGPMKRATFLVKLTHKLLSVGVKLTGEMCPGVRCDYTCCLLPGEMR